MKRAELEKNLKTAQRLVWFGVLALLAVWALRTALGRDVLLCYVLAVLALVSLAAGVGVAKVRLVCPHCGGSLLVKLNLPRQIPETCPRCEKPL